MYVAENWQLERRQDGAVLVRVPSNGTFGIELPDAVFAFRAGDPQYAFWQQVLNERNVPRAPSESAEAMSHSGH
jgi:hypothetical protein